eukprot:NP_001021804.2 Uncharacterized protein CELE_Y71A12B.15 [Caenorhabditis elegans]
MSNRQDRNELYPREDTRKFDNQCSNLIYAKLISKFNSVELTSAMLTYGDLFNVTIVDLRSISIDIDLVKFLYTQKLETLVIGKLDGSCSDKFTSGAGEFLKIACRFCTAFVGVTLTWNIVGLLEHIIKNNKNTRRSLHYLDVSGCATFFQNGWIPKLRVLLPALRTICLESRKFAANEFPKFCKSFPNIRFLDVSSTNVRSLDGISKLRNLQVLCLRNLNFDRYRDMMDLFGLRKLNVLDVSRDWPDNYRQTIRYFLACEKVLPELKFLDCSSAYLDEDLYKELAQSHPHLRKISLLGCAQNLPVIPRLKVLGTQNFDSSIETLSHYLNLKREYPVQICLGEIFLQLRKLNEKNLDYDVAKCVELLVEVTVAFSPTVPGRMACSNAIDCLVELVINKRLHAHETFQIFDAFAKYIVECSTSPGFGLLETVYNDIERHRPDIWNDFANMLLPILQPFDPVVLNGMEHLNHNVWNGIERLVHMDHEWSHEKLAKIALVCAQPYQTAPDARAMRILEQCITEQTINFVLTGVEKWYSAKRLVNILSVAVGKQDLSLCLRILEALDKNTLITEDRKHNFNAVGWNLLTTLIQWIEIFDLEQWHIGILRVIKNLVLLSKGDWRNNWFLSNEFRAFQKLLNKWDSNRAYLAATILALILQSKQKPEECDFWKPANEAIVKKLPDLLAAHITEETEVYFTNDTVPSVLRRTHGDGIILWALLTTKIFAQQDVKNSEKIQKSNYYRRVYATAKLVLSKMRRKISCF